MKTFFKKLWKDESGQGLTEYAFLLFVVISVVYIFKDKITTTFSAQIETLEGAISSFTSGLKLN